MQMNRLSAVVVAVSILASPALADPYITRDQVDFTHILPAPPALTSGAGQRDIAEVLRTRADADADERAQAMADADVSIFRFADVLGPRFRESRRLQKTVAFFQHVTRDTLPLNSAGKTYWHRDRPFVADPNVNTDPKATGSCNGRDGQPGSAPIPACPHGVSFSYPSGHATFGALTAILLAQMIPEKHDALLARGWDYGRARVVNGVHFPTDVEAGRIAATVMVALMMQNAHFRADLAEAKAELRAVLGYPAAP
jgi:acid phosphatase (class A)